MANDDDPHVAKPNEIGLFISDDNDYRIAVPRAWSEAEHMPRFAYLAVAAILRMATAGQDAFVKELYAWALENVDEKADRKAAKELDSAVSAEPVEPLSKTYH